MKIEKLTDNKIRVILSIEDLEKKNTKIENLITPSVESQSLFLDILVKAEKEVGFYTEGCKLLIECFSSEELFIFTITKYSDIKSDSYGKSHLRKKLSIKKKSYNISNKNAIYSFDNFETFCDFCNNINSITNLDITKISKNISLYLYNNTYYIILSNINTDFNSLNIFYSSISEFGKLVNYSDNFQNKLFEHGKLLIKKNAISTCVKHFL